MAVTSKGGETVQDGLLRQVQELGGQLAGDESLEGLEAEEIIDQAPNPEVVLSDLMRKFNYADNWRKQYDEKATEWYKLYVGYKEKAETDRSNLHIPRTYEQLDTLRARLVKSFVSQRPYVEFIPRIKPRMSSTDYEDNERKADIAAALVDHQMEQNDVVIKLYNHITSMLIFPVAIMGVGWRYEEKTVTRKEPVMMPVIDPMTGQPVPDMSKAQPLIDPTTGQPVIDPSTGQPVPDPASLTPLIEVVGTQLVESDEVSYDDNEFINIDFFDFWPDPRGSDIDDCRFVFHREWSTRGELESKMNLLADGGGGYVFEPNWETIGKGGDSQEGKWERLSAVGLTPETSDGTDKSDAETLGLYEVLHYWEDERYCIVVNRNALIYDGPNPYWRHSKKPFVVSSFEPLPGEFYGMSAVQLIEHLQAEVNTHRNQRIDNVSLVLNKMWKVRRDADIDESDLISRPHGIVWVDDPNDVMPMETGDVTASSYNEEQITKQDMENTLAVPSVVRGADSARAETATEVVTKSTNAGMRFDIKIMLFENIGFKRLAHLMDLNNQQYIDDQRLIKLVGEDGAYEWQEVNQFEIIGEFDYRPAGANVDPAANKELRRQQLIELVSLAAQTQSPYINQAALWKALVNSFDLRNTDDLIRSEEEVQEEQYKQMVMMQQAELQAQQQQAMEQQETQQQADQQAIMQALGGGG